MVLTLGAWLAAPGAQAAQAYNATFTTLNDSGVTGTAMLSLDSTDSLLTVTIHATGLEAGVLHVAHIHGLSPGGLPGRRSIQQRRHLLRTPTTTALSSWAKA